MLGLDWQTLSLFFVGAISLFIFFSYLRWQPVQWVGKALVQIVIGIFLLFFLNVFGQFIHFSLPYNLLTVGIAGFLGLPGVLALICIKFFLI